MTTIFETIQADYMAVRKQMAQGQGSDVARALLSTLIGKITGRAKDEGNRAVTTDDVQKSIKFYVDGATTTLEHRPEDPQAKEELVILQKYQDLITASKPPQLSIEELQGIIQAQGFTEMGSFMKYLKANHAGHFENAAAKKAFDTK